MVKKTSYHHKFVFTTSPSKLFIIFQTAPVPYYPDSVTIIYLNMAMSSRNPPSQLTRSPMKRGDVLNRRIPHSEPRKQSRTSPKYQEMSPTSSRISRPRVIQENKRKSQYLSPERMIKLQPLYPSLVKQDNSDYDKENTNNSPRHSLSPERKKPNVIGFGLQPPSLSSSSSCDSLISQSQLPDTVKELQDLVFKMAEEYKGRMDKLQLQLDRQDVMLRYLISQGKQPKNNDHQEIRLRPSKSVKFDIN